MKVKKAAGSIVFFADLIVLWQLLYVAATDCFE